MAQRIEDYAFLSDMESAALVGRDGSIDWLTFPRFDSPACFSALLGDRNNGRWQLVPASPIRSITRRYRAHSLILDTTYVTEDGTVVVTDVMPPRNEHLEVVRIVRGVSGQVAMRMELVVRFDYGSIVPWVRRVNATTITAVGGPDALRLHTPVPVVGHDLTTVARFPARAGDQIPFVLQWHPAHEPCSPLPDPFAEVAAAERWWADWNQRTTYTGPWEEQVRSSLTVLKGLTYAPTGGLVAAATTSLPEWIGGPRNWDYRYCWLRDATFSLLALLNAGHKEEAQAWRDWLLRAVAGNAQDLQIMYGLAGERRLPEAELPWLAGYEGSQPVRIGNAAAEQFQLDVYGEVADALYQARLAGVTPDPKAWSMQQAWLDFLESGWKEADEGLWEVRGPRQHFTHSKVMAWVAADRMVRSVERFGKPGPVDQWRQLRSDIHRWVLDNCVDDRGALVQHPGTTELDASVLMVPLVGFLPPDDPRVTATIAAIEQELTVDGFVLRYRSDETLDGLPEGEGAFLLCSFWLAEAKAMAGDITGATDLFERLLALRNDVGLLSEEYDPVAKRALGNVPQAFSHTALITTAALLSGHDGLRRLR